MRGPLLLAAGCFLLSACTNPDVMQDQPKAKPFRGSAFFGDGRSMRPLPANVVPQERRRGNDVRLTGRQGNAYADALPVPLTRPLLERGHERYDIYCAPCHGLLGDGNGVVGQNFAQRRPPALVLRFGQSIADADGGFLPSRARDDGSGLRFAPGYYFAVMTEGYGLMAPYAGELSVEDRWAVVAYLRALALSQRMPLASAPPEVQQSLRQEKAP